MNGRQKETVFLIIITMMSLLAALCSALAFVGLTWG